MKTILGMTDFHGIFLFYAGVMHCTVSSTNGSHWQVK